MFKKQGTSGLPEVTDNINGTQHTVVLRCRWEKKKLHGLWVVPNDTSTFSVLENQKNEMFQRGLFEDAEAEGGRLVKEADFEAEIFFLV